MKIRPKFLYNHATKSNMELDGYNDELKLAFEYNGWFHYEENNWMSRTLEEVREKDEMKEGCCEYEGITLITIPHWVQNKEAFNFGKQLK